MIVDLVRSRQQIDRSDTQRKFAAALSQVNRWVDSMQELEPTVGDEAQALYADIPSALMASLLLRLYLPKPLDCRFGVGVGFFESVGVSAFGTVQDGSAWWTARDAIVETKRRETGRQEALRTWFAIAEDVPQERIQRYSPPIVNAFLLCRDEIVTGLSERNRRRLLGLLEGKSQVEIAESESVTPGAISQSLRTSGILAVLASQQLLQGAA